MRNNCVEKRDINLRSFITLPYKKEWTLPEEYKDEDFRMPESLVRFFLEKYTKEGDKVLDIFAGLGTTLRVAEDMKRIGYGIEYERNRVNYTRITIEKKQNIVHGDSMDLLSFNLPMIDFSMTSPPYMNKDDSEYALTAYTTRGTYKQYLNDLQRIYTQLKQILKPNAYTVIEVANLKRDEVTTLAWDIGNKISKVLHFEGEVIIGWEGDEKDEGTYGCGYDHSYCLVFKNT